MLLLPLPGSLSVRIASVSFGASVPTLFYRLIHCVFIDANSIRWAGFIAAQIGDMNKLGTLHRAEM